MTKIVDIGKKLNTFSKIPGFLSSQHGQVLLFLSLYGPGNKDEGVLEVGSYLGKSTVHLATGSVISGRKGVTTIDIFPSIKDWYVGSDGNYHLYGSGYSISKSIYKARASLVYEKGRCPSILEFFLQTIKKMGLENNVTSFKGTSKEFVETIPSTQKFRLIFIDGDHSYEGVKKDIDFLSDLLIEGGIMCFHDYSPSRGVFKAVNDHIVASPKFSNFTYMRNLFIARKS